MTNDDASQTKSVAFSPKMARQGSPGSGARGERGKEHPEQHWQTEQNPADDVGGHGGTDCK